MAYNVLAYSVSPVKKQAVVDALLNCVGTFTAVLMPAVVLISNSAPLVDTKVRPVVVCKAFSALGKAVTWATCAVAAPATTVASVNAPPRAALLHVCICPTCIFVSLILLPTLSVAGVTEQMDVIC